MGKDWLVQQRMSRKVGIISGVLILLGIIIVDAYLLSTMQELDMIAHWGVIGRLVLVICSMPVVLLGLLFIYVWLKHSRKNYELVEKLHTDTLTGLSNRKGMGQYFNELPSLGKDYAFIVVNMNRFKKLNETLGFEAANEMLKRIAKVLKASVFGQEAAFRMESDHFVVFLRAEGPVTVDSRIKEILKQLDALVLCDMQSTYSCNCSFSCGVYVLDGTVANIDNIEDRALVALGKMKRLGKSGYLYFDEAMQEELEYKNQMLSGLDEALTKRQFAPYFQPQYNITDGKVIGADISPHWHHPTLGEIPAKDFIPLLEFSGRSWELDFYLLEEACKMVQKWLQDELMPVPISVNISKLSVYRYDFIARLLAVVKQYHISTRLIVLEMDAGIITAEESTMLKIAQELHEQGFQLGANNFGVGQFSLSMLYQFPLDVLKLGQGVLAGNYDKRKLGGVLQAILKNAQQMGMIVAAEGVKEASQVKMLKLLGCTQVQGEFYAEPIGLGEFEKMIF